MVYMGRSWFNIPIYTRQIAYSAASKFSTKETSSMNAGRTHVAFHAIYVEENGKRIKIAEGIEGKDAAQALLDEIL